ncbi:MAG: SAM-dependent methyltransferase [Bacteroidetes bacterium]|nr:SAM-dependent methyltransferase [Bacteroidota bacterium]MBS1739791.1 SAM-dependent methyltransferase [Bacteroidota bacterium]
MIEEASLLLIPVPIADGALHTISHEVHNYTLSTKYYFVENLRSARRFLKALHPLLEIDSIHFSEIDKHNGADINLLKRWLSAGLSVGVLSESGCPGVADPGAELVEVAQHLGVKVIPLTGPNSLLLALMASGLNGQSFCFHGYLPIKEPARTQQIKATEIQSKRDKQTQLFIETPYRNQTLFSELTRSLQASTKLCIAQNISAPNALIRTKTIAEWRKQGLELQKVPTVFLFLS